MEQIFLVDALGAGGGKEVSMCIPFALYVNPTHGVGWVALSLIRKGYFFSHF